MKTLRYLIPVALIVIGSSTKAFAINFPEVSPADSMTALALVAGSVMIFRNRIKR